jgi:cytochrome c-type biogenesis protein CcmH
VGKTPEVVAMSFETSRPRGAHAALLTLMLVAVFLLALTVPAAGAEGDLSPEQQALASKIEGKLIAPCCWTQTVEVHDSQKAEEIKMQVALLISQGKGEDEILDIFVDQYGEEILAAPRASGFNYLAYVLPFAVIIVGLGALAFLASRWQRPIAAPATTISEGESKTDGETSDDMQKRLDEELGRYDQ